MRPTHLHDLVIRKVLDAVRAGNSRNVAAQYAGVSPGTLYRWMQRAAAGEQPYADFADKVAQAESEAEVIALSVINKAARGGDWKAASWWLERRYPERYAIRPERFADPVDRMTEAEVRAELAKLG